MATFFQILTTYYQSSNLTWHYITYAVKMVLLNKLKLHLIPYCTEQFLHLSNQFLNTEKKMEICVEFVGSLKLAY
jgi:hypothetical protein